MEYIDPVETARRILAGEDVPTMSEDTPDEILDSIVEETSDEEVEVEEVEEAKKNVKLAQNGNDDDDDEEEVDESETILDVDDNQDAEGKKATPTPKGKDKDSKNKATIKAKSSKASGKVETPKEHIDVLFSGEELSEEFKLKATTIFEAAINESVSSLEDSLREEYDTALAEHTERVSNELAEKLDDYLSYVVEQWMSENELAIESGIKNDITENFLVGLRDLFEKHYVDLPEDRANILEAMAQEVIDTQGKLEGELENNISLRKEISELKCDEIVSDACEGLVDIDAEKLRSLVEGLEFESVDQYKEKVALLKENYFDGAITETDKEDGESTENTLLDDSSPMSTYSAALSRTAKNAKENRLV